MSAASAILEPKMAAAGQRCEDGVPDMTAISDIDVVGVNTNLRVRFERNEIYTFTGTILVATNPYEFLPIYEKDMMMMYNGRKMGALPPHVFATAEASVLTHVHTWTLIVHARTSIVCRKTSIGCRSPPLFLSSPFSYADQAPSTNPPVAQCRLPT